MKICIIGGVAGGASAATRLRRLDEHAQIILFERGEYISYANCGLPYYIGGAIQNQEDLLVTTPQFLKHRFRIDVRIQNEVLSINRETKTLSVKNHQTGEIYEESYDKLILSPGAEPKRPPLPGIDSPGVFTLRTVPDTLRIDEYIRSANARRAVVVGGGFIGIEMAENLKARGLQVSLVEFSDQVLPPFDREMANLLHRHLAQHGVHLLLKTALSSIAHKKDGTLIVSLSSGAQIETDIVLLSLGVSPENKLAKEAGLTLGAGKGIQVNEYLQTSDPDIYAVGDAICVQNLVSRTETLIPLAGPANRQGRLAAENILGGRKSAGAVQGSSVLKVFDMTAASTGLNEKQCRALGLSYHKTYVHPQAHASYYPGATPISMKLLFMPDGHLLGAQAVGYEGVEKRIDVLAAVLRLNGTVYDLEQLELCYAPPYSSAKDPVNMLGFTACNLLKGDMPVFYAEEAASLDPENTIRLDVSTPPEVLMGTIEGFQNLPLDTLREHLHELDKNKPVYVICRVGLRGYLATRILKQHGFKAYNLSGGYKTYRLVCERKSEYLPEAPHSSSGAAGHSSAHPLPLVKTIVIDACALSCPGPIQKVEEAMKTLSDGEQVLIRVSDPAFSSDLRAWCRHTSNQVISHRENHGSFEVVLQKGTKK